MICSSGDRGRCEHLRIGSLRTPHWNHKMLVEKGHRPADYGQQICDNWRKLVQPQDFVYHLGDVILGKNGTLGAIMSTLPGTKYLVRGNHDHGTDSWYMRHGFSFVAQGILRAGVWLSHAPAPVLPSGAVLNVHGHLHANEHHLDLEQPLHSKLLSLEKVGYKPVLFGEFVGFNPVVTSSRLGALTN